MKNNKGVTLTELLIVIVIMGIVGSFSVVAIGNVLSNTRYKADLQTVTSLNEATSLYLLGENPVELFPAEYSSEDNLNTLVTLGYMSKMPEVLSGDGSFEWDTDTNVWYFTADGEQAPLSPYGSTPQEISSSLITIMQERVTSEGRYGRSWGDYRYTDLGIDPDDFASPIMHVNYTPSGSSLLLRPEEGYQFTMLDMNGETKVLKESYNWNLVYDDLSKNWYYHSIKPENQIQYNTLQIELS